MKKLLPLFLLFAACQKETQRPAMQYVTVNVKAFLQGAFDSTTGGMRRDLNQQGLLSKEQPFSGAPWFYSGSERMDSYDSTVVHWVLIELWNGQKQVVGRSAALITANGTCVAPTRAGGLPTVGVETSDTDFYIVLRHLNHLAVRTPVLRSYPYDADFTISNESSYGNATVWYGGRWNMRGGNANGDKLVKVNGPGNDELVVRNKLGYNYYPNTGADLDMNGVVDGFDFEFLRNTVMQGRLSLVLNETL